MLITEREDGSATVRIDEYADLLAVRALPEWRMIGEREVLTDRRHLHVLDVAVAPLAVVGEPADYLFDYQRWLVELALDRERFAVFADTGLGKTPMQLDWARIVTDEHRGRTLIVAPLSIVPQTIEEAARFYGETLPIVDCRDRARLNDWLASGSGVAITNYEKLDGTTEPLPVQAVVLDESSALKQSMGARRTSIIAAFKGVRWKLACTATPAPNDRVEYAEHAYFLDTVRSTREFLAAYFVNRDGSWQLKGHGVDAFYRHLASWSVFMRSPAAYGFDDNLRDLPPMRTLFPHVELTAEQAAAARRWESADQASLFGATPGGITSRTKMMQIAHGFELDGKAGVVGRYRTNKPDYVAELCNVTHAGEQVIVWVTFDEEGDQLARLIPDAMHMSGKTPQVRRETIMGQFRSGLGFCLCPRISASTSPTGTANIGNTFANTTAGPRSKLAKTSEPERDTPRTRSTEQGSRRKLESGKEPIPSDDLPNDSSSTGSPRGNTEKSWSGKKASVPSAPTQAPLQMDGSTSTIAMPPVDSVGCFAANATLPSATSETILSVSPEPCSICGNRGRVLLIKPSMFSFGLNLQACAVQVFSTISDSWERYYQAVRRSFRYGQTREVTVYVPLTPLDEAMCQNVMSKQSTFEADAARQEEAFVAVLRPADTTERRRMVTTPRSEMDRAQGDEWTMIQADCVAHMPTMPADSMDLAIFSPPFANLFTYSSEAADMGNVRGDQEYRLQWEFFVAELFRIMKPGRVVAVHCMDVIRFAGQHGHRHTYDYPSDLRAGMERAGFNYHARIAIDKNPQIQATRTKDANLLFATLKRNALDSHPQASECVLQFRKPGEEDAKVHALDISNQEWITWAHHIWYDIRETDVLNAALAKEDEDERHICCLQLGLIERCVRLWSNPGETVFSPFAGIGSEGHEAMEWGRRYYGVELKRAYFETACRFLADKEREVAQRIRMFEPSAT